MITSLSRARRIALVATASLVTLLMVGSAGAVVAPATPAGIAVGFNNPESVEWDPVTEAFYISNADFSGLLGGWIAKLEPGALTPEPFLVGLSGPQGVIVRDGTMYVADTDHVLTVDMADPSQTSQIPTGGGANDLDIDPDTGDIYVTDLGGGKVWKISGGVSTEFVSIDQPDGIFIHDGGVYIANFGFDGAGGIYRFEISDASMTTIWEDAFVALDGLYRVDDTWVATDFVRGHLFRITADGSFELMGQVAPGAADIGYDPVTRTLGLPNLTTGLVYFFTI